MRKCAKSLEIVLTVRFLQDLLCDKVACILRKSCAKNQKVPAILLLLSKIADFFVCTVLWCNLKG